MQRIRYWLTSKRQLIAQLQEARDARDRLVARLGDCQDQYHDKCADHDSARKQLSRLSRERFQERELRIAAERLSKHKLYEDE